MTDPLWPTWRRSVTALTLVPRGLSLVWQAARRWTLAWIVLLAAQGVLPIATVYLTRELVNGLVGLSGGQAGHVLRLVAVLAALLVAGQALRGLSDWVRAAQAELVQDHIADLIHGQAARLDLSFYDTREYYDSLHRARADAFSRPIALLENIGGLLQNGVTLVAMAAILVPYGAWIPLALVLSTAPALGVALWSTLRLHQWRLATTAAQRRTYYYDWLLTDREAAAEVRLFGLAGPFRRAYQAIRRKLHGEQVALLRNQAIADLAAGVIAVAVLGAVLASMVWRALRAHLPLGDLALVYQAFSQGQSLLRTLLGNAGQLYANSLFLENLFDFLALEPRVREPREPASAASRPPRAGDRPRGVRFERVTFRYPGAARPALDGFTLEIPAGRVAAVVGANGAGKTTLIKLLCRFYDPAEGRVLIDGADARDLPLETLRAAITVLFQEPVRYHESAATNIAYGDWTRTPGMDELQEAAGAAGADVVIARLPEGYEEVLGHWFGGTELSVGEWQRLALARAFLRRAPIVALDEPTSAMDSWAEADWMRRFRALVAGRTALIVTHRFTTAMQADVIHVMEAGRIVESGTHTDLVARGARYAESWLAQVGCTR